MQKSTRVERTEIVIVRVRERKKMSAIVLFGGGDWPSSISKKKIDVFYFVVLVLVLVVNGNK